MESAEQGAALASREVEFALPAVGSADSEEAFALREEASPERAAESAEQGAALASLAAGSVYSAEGSLAQGEAPAGKEAVLACPEATTVEGAPRGSEASDSAGRPRSRAKVQESQQGKSCLIYESTSSCPCARRQLALRFLQCTTIRRAFPPRVTAR
ncbi:MAG: hypothetical protein DCC46_10350 [Armatimonadetes bacterium]|nr:MAG: hypothetical protein DCC46_10350 [Armatimonadota bacterium]